MQTHKVRTCCWQPSDSAGSHTLRCDRALRSGHCRCSTGSDGRAYLVEEAEDELPDLRCSVHHQAQLRVHAHLCVRLVRTAAQRAALPAAGNAAWNTTYDSYEAAHAARSAGHTVVTSNSAPVYDSVRQRYAPIALSPSAVISIAPIPERSDCRLSARSSEGTGGWPTHGWDRCTVFLLLGAMYHKARPGQAKRLPSETMGVLAGY